MIKHLYLMRRVVSRDLVSSNPTSCTFLSSNCRYISYTSDPGGVVSRVVPMLSGCLCTSQKRNLFLLVERDAKNVTISYF